MQACTLLVSLRRQPCLMPKSAAPEALVTALRAGLIDLDSDSGGPEARG